MNEEDGAIASALAMTSRAAPMEIDEAVWYVAEKLLAAVDREHFTELLDAIEPYPDVITDPIEDRHRVDGEALQRLRARLRPLVIEQLRTFAHDGETLALLRSAYSRYRTWPRGSMT